MITLSQYKVLKALFSISKRYAIVGEMQSYRITADFEEEYSYFSGMPWFIQAKAATADFKRQCQFLGLNPTAMYTRLEKAA